MKRILCAVFAALLLTGCTAVPQETESTATSQPQTTEQLQTPEQEQSYEFAQLIAPQTPEITRESQFTEETVITLSGDTISVEGNAESVYTSNDIIYYEDMEAYPSGNPYGEGEENERHSAQEAAEHLVVNITAPGAYRVTGKLDKGQIRIDLGEDAYEDPNAVVELTLDDADITCTVAPAVLFLNVYEADGAWSTETAKPEVDTTKAGANLILQGENKVTGSHVAKIFKDNEEEKKLWKQDGAVYSYMSMNVFGPGKLELTADNEGMDTELHLTINGGEIAIRSDNDGINTNEDGVSVTTINAGSVHIIAGLGAEGDGIDSNGYLVINGGTVVASANPAADAGLDSDLGSYINGGYVIALGSTMDWAESESNQVTLNLQFAQYQSSGSAVAVTRPDGTVIFAYDPSEDEVLAENQRQYMGAIVSCPNFYVGESYHVYLDGTVEGTETGGIYDVTSHTTQTDGVMMAYTGTDVQMRPGGMGMFGDMGMFGGMGGQRPEMPEGEIPQKPDGEMPGRREEFDGQIPEGTMPEDFEFGKGFEGKQPPEGFTGEIPEGTMPEGFVPGKMFDGKQFGMMGGEANTIFYMQDKVNFFSGLTAAEQ